MCWWLLRPQLQAMNTRVNFITISVADSIFLTLLMHIKSLRISINTSVVEIPIFKHMEPANICSHKYVIGFVGVVLHKYA